MHYSQGDLAILSAETYNPGGKLPAAIPQSNGKSAALAERKKEAEIPRGGDSQRAGGG